MTGPAMVEVTDRDLWLRERESGIGASEAPAALGISSYQSPLDLYLRKTGAVPPAEQSESMRLGLYLEPYLATRYHEIVGRQVARTQVFARHPAYHETFATVDAIDESGTIVEFKTTSSPAIIRQLGESGTDQVPDEWLVQCHQQAAVFGTNRVQLLVLVGGRECRLFDIHVAPVLSARVLAGVVRFWRDHVVSRVPPEPTAKDLGVLSAIRPREGTSVVLDSAASDLARRWRQAKAEAAEADSLAKERKAHLLAAIGDAETATTDDGLMLRRRVVRRGAYTCKATEYVTLAVANEGSNDQNEP